MIYYGLGEHDYITTRIRRTLYRSAEPISSRYQFNCKAPLFPFPQETIWRAHHSKRNTHLGTHDLWTLLSKGKKIADADKLNVNARSQRERRVNLHEKKT